MDFLAAFLSEDFAQGRFPYLFTMGFRFVLIAIECAVLLNQSRQIDFKEMRDSFLLQLLSRVVRLGSVFAIYVFAYEHRLIQMDPHSVGTILFAFILTDFLFYWEHRYQHQTKVGWAGHIVHHTTSKLNFTASIRPSSAYQLSLQPITKSLVIFIGVPPMLAIECYMVIMVYQFWIHTEIIPKLGWLEYIFNTPSHHRVHHATNPEYRFRNFGGMLITWDIIFGTFREEDPAIEKRYGIGQSVENKNFLQLYFMGWVGLVKEICQRKSLAVLFEGTSIPDDAR